MRVKHTIYRFTVAITLMVMLASVASAFDLPSPRSYGMGQTAVLSRSTAAEAVNIGHGLEQAGDWSFDIGYVRRFEMKDLDRVFVIGAGRWRAVTVGFGAAQFGRTDLYAEQTLKGTISVEWSRWTLGGSVSGQQIEIGNGYGGLRAASFGFTMAYRHPEFVLALTGDDLNRPSYIEGSPEREPSGDLYAEYIGARGYTLTGHIRVEHLQTPRFGLGQTIRLSDKAGLFWGLSTNPLEFGGGLEILIPSGALSYATSVHPVLGFTHAVTLSLGNHLTRAITRAGLD